MGMISLFSDLLAVNRVCKELMGLEQGTRNYLFECLKEFVVCPWWSRIWVVQEVAVATAVTVRYGTITMSWDALVATADVWSSPETRLVATSAGIEPENLKVFALFTNQLIGLEQTRRKWRTQGGTDLARLLQEFSDRQATDDRDKVYGLLGLAKQDQHDIEAAYGLDVSETYRVTALTLIGNRGSLACWCGDQKRKFHRGLPSWVPDWSTAAAVADKRRLELFHHYRANRGWTLRLINSECEYWATVEEQMELLMNSLVGKARMLPASLSPFVHDYSVALTHRVSLLRFPRITGEELGRWVVYPFIWDNWKGVTPTSTMSRLKCYEQSRVFSLMKIPTGKFEKPNKRYLTDAFGAVHTWFGIHGSSDGEQIHQYLLELGAALSEEDSKKGLVNFEYAIRELVFVIEVG
jgi:hypothetical protein